MGVWVGDDGGLQDYIVSPRSFGFSWVLELIRTWLGLGDFGTKGLGPELDN